MKQLRSALAMWLMVFVSKLVLKHMDDEGVKAIVAMAQAIDRIK